MSVFKHKFSRAYVGVSKINIKPLAKLLTTVIDKAMTKQTQSSKAQKETSTATAKTVVTKQTKKTTTQPKISLPSTQPQEDSPTQANPVIPAPLKSTLFEKAQFFYREYPQGDNEAAGGSGMLLVKLDTLSLGQLWITVSSQKDMLAVAFYNNNKSSIDLLKENLDDLKEELHGSEFKNLFIKCQVTNDNWLQNNVLKNFKMNNVSFINLKV